MSGPGKPGKGTGKGTGKGKRNVRAAIESAQPAAGSAPPGATGAPQWLRDLFELREDGLFRKKSEKMPEIWLSAPFTIEAETRDEAGEGWGFLLAFRDRDGRTKRQAFPRAMFTGDCAELRARLADAGLSLNGYQKARQAFAEYLNIASSPRRARSANRIGWHFIGARPVFLLPDITYGEAGEAVVLQGAHREPSLFGVAGALAEWRDGIGLWCGSNSRLIFAASCGFAGPLLSLLNQSGAGFNFRGKSKIGKSTLLRVAASVCGGTARDGAGGYMRNWHASISGIEAVAANSNDCLLVLDELGQLDPKEAGEMAYLLANGAGKIRAHRSMTAQPVARWQLLFLSSGEAGIEERIAEGGKRMKAGQEGRLIDIPADAGAGLGVFEELHGADGFNDFAGRLWTATTRLHGTPLRALVAKLVHDMRDGSAPYLDRLRERCNSILADLLATSPAAGGQVRSIAARFAMVGLAGELATEGVITPWNPGEAVAAARTCLQAYLAERGTLGAREDAQAATQLRAFLSRHGEARLVPWSDSQAIAHGVSPGEPAPDMPPDPMMPAERFRTQQRAGWRRWVKRKDGTMAWRFYLTSEGMAEAMAGLAPREATKTLAELGLIIPHKASSNVLKKVLAGLHSVPGQGVVRLYEIADDVLGWEPGE